MTEDRTTFRAEEKKPLPIRNPIHDAQKRALQAEAICHDILQNSRNQLYLNMRFLDCALAGLAFQGDMSVHPLGTDGSILYYQPAPLYFSPCISGREGGSAVLESGL